MQKVEVTATEPSHVLGQVSADLGVQSAQY